MFNQSSRCQRRSQQGRAQRLHSFSRSWQRNVLVPAIFFATFLPLGLIQTAYATAAGDNWNGGDGNWNTAAQWSQGVPTSTTTASNTTSGSITHDSGDDAYSTFNSSGAGNFYLSGGSLTGGAFSVNASALFQISGGATLRNATVSGAPITFIGSGTLDHITANSNLNLSSGSGTIVNGLTLNATATVTSGQGLYLNGAETIGGTGTIVLGGSTTDTSYLLLDSQGVSSNFTLGPGITVDALSGSISNSVYGGTLVNQDTLQASGAGRSLSISTSGVLNSGTIKAANGGIVTLGTSVDNTSGGANMSGILSADAASSINLNGQTVTGGTLTGGGTFTGGGSLVGGVAVNGTLDLSAASLNVSGGLTLNGQATVTNGQGLYLNGAETIGGTGTIVLGGSTTDTSYLLLDSQGVSSNFTLGPGITVDALSGSIGNSVYGGILVNQGTLQANGAGRTLSIAPSGVVNQGTIQATGGGAVTLNSATDNTNHTITSTGTGSLVTLQGTLINTGGTLQASSGGTFVLGGVTVTGGTIAGVVAPISVTSGSTLDGVGGPFSFNASSASLTLSGGETLSGTSTVTSGQGLYLNGAETIGGTGTIRLGANTADTSYLLLDSQGVSSNFTLGPGITVDALSGSISNSVYGGTLVNQGTLQANGAGRVLNIATNAVLNSGTIKAAGGGLVNLGTSVDNTSGGANNSGILSADAASSINLGGQTVTGGTLTGGGTFTGGGSLVGGVVVNGKLDLSAASLNVSGGLTLNGQATVTNGQGLYLNSAETIGGMGTIRLGANTADTSYLLLDSQGVSSNFTLGPGITVDALSGSISNSVYGGILVNQGTLQASGAGRSLTINTSGLVNNGAIIASGAGSTVTVSSATTGSGTVSTSVGGTVTFSGGSAIQQAAGTSQIDGNVNFGSSSTFTVAGGTLKGSGTVTGNVVNSGGTVAPGDSPGTLNVNGSFAQSGTGVLSIEFTKAAHDLLAITGNAVTGGIINFSFLDTSVAAGVVGQTFDFLDSTGLSTSISNALFTQYFSNETAGGLVTEAGPGGGVFRIAQNSQNPNDLQVTVVAVTPAAAPEPSQWAAFAIGLLGLGALALKARKRIA